MWSFEEIQLSVAFRKEKMCRLVLNLTVFKAFDEGCSCEGRLEAAWFSFWSSGKLTIDQEKVRDLSFFQFLWGPCNEATWYTILMKQTKDRDLIWITSKHLYMNTSTEWIDIWSETENISSDWNGEHWKWDNKSLMIDEA